MTVKLIHINGRAGVDDSYYDGSTSERARKPLYVPSLLEQKPGVDYAAAKLNMRDSIRSEVA